MGRNISYKKQLYYLLASGVLAFILAYWIAISKTIETRQNFKAIDQKLRQIEAAPESIAEIKKRMMLVNEIIGENHGDIPEFQKGLLDRISSYCAENSLILKEFPEVRRFQKQEYRFITAYASIEGSFIPLLKLLYALETSPATGRIISVSFTSKEDRRLKKARLSMSVYVQTIKQISNGQLQ